MLVSRVEWKRAQGLGGRLRGYLPQHWPEGLVPTLVDFDGPPVGPFLSSHDIARDGSLVLVPTPGHTPGHASLVAAESAFLGGDMAHSEEELRATAPEVVRWCDDEGLPVLLAHDPD